jgi:hypothetical protein
MPPQGGTTDVAPTCPSRQRKTTSTIEAEVGAPLNKTRHV